MTFGFLLSQRKSLTVAAIQSGFHKIGIFPVNRNVIKISDLGPSGATDNLANLQENNKHGKNCILKFDVHFVINCFLYCRLFVLIVHFPVLFHRPVTTTFIYILVYIIFYLFTFVIADQKDLLMELAKASQHLQPTCAQQALAGWLGGGIAPPLAADASNVLLAVQQAGGLQGDGVMVMEVKRKRNLMRRRMTRLEKSM